MLLFSGVNNAGLGLGLGLNNLVVDAGFSLFDYDENSFYTDFLDAGNTIETTGDDTLAVAPDLIVGTQKLVQQTKDYQPLVTANGINCNQDTARQMTFDDISGIANGTSGYYLELNAKFTTADSYIMSIARAASTAASRGLIYVSGSRNFGIKADENDGGAPNWLAYTSALTLDTWYTLGLQFNADGVDTNPVTIWVNGVEQTLAYDAGASFAPFPSTSPSEVILFNDTTNAKSWDGGISHFLFYNAVPSAAMRSSMSTYLNSVRPS